MRRVRIEPCVIKSGRSKTDNHTQADTINVAKDHFDDRTYTHQLLNIIAACFAANGGEFACTRGMPSCISDADFEVLRMAAAGQCCTRMGDVYSCSCSIQDGSSESSLSPIVAHRSSSQIVVGSCASIFEDVHAG